MYIVSGVGAKRPVSGRNVLEAKRPGSEMSRGETST